MIETAKFPSMSIRQVDPSNKLIYELFVEQVDFKDSSSLPTLRLEVAYNPHFLWLFPSSPVFSCTVKKMFKQVFTVNFGICKTINLLYDIELYWP